MKNNAVRLLTIFLILLWTGACATSPNPVMTNLTSTETIFTQTALPINTETTQPSTETPIPLPTIETANAEIQRLLSDEKGCSFPCWWGLTPGETQVGDVRNLLESFSIFSVGTPGWSSEEGHIRLIVPQTRDSFLHLTFVYKGRNEVLQRLWTRIQMMRRVTDADGRSNYEVSWGDPLLAEITKPYNLSQVLSKYGRPSEVLIRTYRATLLNQPWPISLVVFYPDQGFMIEYVADGEGSPNSNIAWCPSLAFPNFWFWSPSTRITLSDVVSEIPGEQLDQKSLVSGSFKTVEEAAGMSVEEFYSMFTNNEDKCLETPANLWPMPGQ